MNIECALEERLLHGESPEELRRKLRTGLVVLEYLQAELSLGEVAELLDMNPEQTLTWLNSMGVPTHRRMSPELEALSQTHLQQLIAARRETQR